MHSYLKSIGFSNIGNRKEMDEILKDVIDHYDEKIEVEIGNDRYFTEVSKIYGCDFGITIWGEYDENEEFQIEYYYPYFRGTGISTQEEILVERHAGRESYAGACDDVRIGVTVIFYLQNAGEYLSERKKGNFPSAGNSLTLSGLAKEGKILLPVLKDVNQEKVEKENTINRNHMIAAARNGDEDAMDNLTMEDIDLYAMISRRIAKEDVYSIVDTYFMPYGMECDQYNIMGDIIDFTEVKNTDTGESVYELSLMCNDVQLDICINKEDLLGEPLAGRRFKGVVWLQGYLNF